MTGQQDRIVLVSRLRLKVDEDTFVQVAQRAMEESSREPGVLAYDWYYNKESGECDSIAVFADSQVVVDHVRGPFGVSVLPELLNAAEILRSDMYGNPSEELLELLSPRKRVVHPGPTFCVPHRPAPTA